MEIYDAKRVFADFCNFAHAWRQCSPFLGNAGQNFGQHAGIFEWLVRASPHRDSFGVRGRRAYVWDQHDGRCGSGVSGLGPRSIRADYGRWTCLPAPNHPTNRCPPIATTGTFGESKRSRTRAIRDEGPGPLQDCRILQAVSFFSDAPSREVDALKLVAEYMRDVILFEQMASREPNLELKEALETQAKAYRKLADKRAKELGLTPLEPPPSR